MLKRKEEGNEWLRPINLNITLLYFQLVADLHFHLLEASTTMPRQRMLSYSRPCRPKSNHKIFVFTTRDLAIITTLPRRHKFTKTTATATTTAATSKQITPSGPWVLGSSASSKSYAEILRNIEKHLTAMQIPPVSSRLLHTPVAHLDSYT